MKLSRSFLRDYIDISDIETKDLAEKMVFAGNEYESISKVARATGCKIGEILSCINHPESDHLHICTVDYGEGEKTIVCGASNVKEGIKVIVATVGALLPGGEIKQALVAGISSNGMICALSELGIDTKYLKEEDHDGIHVLPQDAPIGVDAIAYLGLDDEVIDFELTANRGDLLSVLGMAYEVGAIYDRKVEVKESTFTESEDRIDKYMNLSVETDDCSMYLGKIVENVTIGESPLFIRNRLMASGIRPINNVVDISNYVMLEYGQPLHFFDKDQLGNKVIVRSAKEGEGIVTLDQKERTLLAEDIVVSSEKEPICVAGVMGGISTEVEKTTKNIFIEAAIFDPIRIRKTSNRILRSEASNRYEKGIDPNRCERAMKRACELLEKYADGKVMGGMLSHDQVNKQDKEIQIQLYRINKVLGMELSEVEVGDTLRKLGFVYTNDNGSFIVLVPTRRMDVNIECDLFEEIGRIHGYQHLKGTVPVVPIKRGGYSLKTEKMNQIRNRFLSLGLHLVRSYSLVSETESKQFAFRDFDHIQIKAPLTEDRKIMRTSLIPSLLSIYEYNVARSMKDIHIFEVGSIYYKIEGEYIEETMISGLLTGNLTTNTWNGLAIKADFYTLKGMVTNVLDYMGLAGRYTFDAQNLLEDVHPYRSTYIKVDNEIIGYMGQVHPNISKKEVYVFELSLDVLLAKKVRNIKYKEISKYPSVHKDLAFVVSKETSSETILKVLKKVGGRLLTSSTIFDVYTGENVGSDEKSIAYSLTFGDPTKTLQDEEVTSIFNKMIAEVENKCNAKLRR